MLLILALLALPLVAISLAPLWRNHEACRPADPPAPPTTIERTEPHE